MELIKWYLKPFPTGHSIGKRFISALVISTFVCLFLLIFQPFGFSQLPPGERVLIGLGYGFTCLSILVFSLILLPHLFPSLFRESEWTVIKEISFTLFNFFLVGLGNTVFATGGNFQRFNLATLAFSQAVTISIGIFPVTGFIFLKQIRLSKKHLREAKALNANLSLEKAGLSAKEVKPTLTKICLHSDNGKESFEIEPENLLCLTSAENYLEIFFTRDAQLKRTLLRSTLQKMEEQLSPHPQFFRCHRTHILNLHHIQSVSANAQGCKVRLSWLEQDIPVSRARQSAFKERLSSGYQ